MSKHRIVSEIRKELSDINEQIDRAIIAGKPYTREARRHRTLLSTLERVRTESLSALSLHSFGKGRSPVRLSLARGCAQRLFCGV